MAQYSIAPLTPVSVVGEDVAERVDSGGRRGNRGQIAESAGRQATIFKALAVAKPPRFLHLQPTEASAATRGRQLGRSPHVSEAMA